MLQQALTADAGRYLVSHILRRISGSLTSLGLANICGGLCAQRISPPEEWNQLRGSIKLFRAHGGDPVRYVVLPETSGQSFKARVIVLSNDHNLQR